MTAAHADARGRTGRTLVIAAALLASAAGVVIVARRTSPARDAAATAAHGASRSEAIATTRQSAAPTVSLLESERALLAAPTQSRAQAFATFRDAWSRRRAERVTPRAASERATGLAESEHERALVAYDAGRDSDASSAIERALAAAEAIPEREREFTAGLLLTAELVYARAGRDEAARWAHHEASVLLTRDGAP